MSAKTERINLRCSAGALDLLRQAAELQDQDLTSFVLGAALDRARAVLTEDRVLRLSPVDVPQLERALDAAPAAVPQLAKLLEDVQSGRTRARRDAEAGRR